MTNGVRRDPAAFSLIELLAAAACIAVLCALLFPAFQNITQSGKKVACLKSLQQVYVLSRAFAADNDNSIPWTKFDVTKQSYVFWISRVSEYAGAGKWNEYTLTCPMSPYSKGKASFGAIVHNANYGMNDGMTCYEQQQGQTVFYTRKIGGAPSPLSRPYRFSDFSDASNTVMYFDSGCYTIYQASAKAPTPAWAFIPGYEKNEGKVFYPALPAVNRDAHEGRHGKTINYVHLDGSMGTAPVKEFVENAEYWRTTRQ